MPTTRRGGNHASPADENAMKRDVIERYAGVSVRSLKAQLSRAGVENAGIRGHARLSKLALVYEVEITDGEGRVL